MITQQTVTRTPSERSGANSRDDFASLSMMSAGHSTWLDFDALMLVPGLCPARDIARHCSALEPEICRSSTVMIEGREELAPIPNYDMTGPEQRCTRQIVLPIIPPAVAPTSSCGHGPWREESQSVQIHADYK
jgi:hypothetical protein